MTDRLHIDRLGRLGALIVTVLVVGILPGCRLRPGTTGPASLPIVWPPLPDTPRVAWVQSVRVPADLGIRANWLVRFFDHVIHGRRVHGMARPYAVSVAPDGTIVVADPDARSVHLFGIAKSKYRRILEADGKPLVSPVGVATDGSNRIYVADSARAAVFRFDTAGKWLDTVGAGEKLARPTGLAFDRGRNVLYVVDTLGHRIVGFDGEGRRVMESGRRGQGDGEFNYPVAVAVDAAGRLYVSDSMNFRVQVLDASGRFLRAFGGPGTGPGGFDKAKGIALDPDGDVYVVEGLHDVIHVFDAEGRLLTVVGGTGTQAGEFGLPAGIHIDPNGRILVADSANHRIQILRYLGNAAAGAGGS